MRIVSERIPLCKPAFSGAEIEALKEVAESGWIGRGPRAIELEERFADFVEVAEAVSLNSATAALHLALLAADVEGQEVLTTSMTFVSTNQAILHAGGRPVFCDIDPDTLTIDPQEVARKITPTTRAIVVMHYGGHACDMDPILELADQHGLYVIEDVAQGCGGSYRDRMLGSLGYIGCFSFQATKNMTTGDGGMLVTNDAAVAARARRLRWVGINRPTWERFQPGSARRSWVYDVEEIGFKYEMTDLAAALGLVQFARLGALIAARRRLLERYHRELAGVDGLEMVAQREYATSACYNAVIKTDRRDELYEFLDGEGIDSNVHYYPNHLFSIFRPYTTRLPVTEREWQRILSIPLYPDLSIDQQNRVTQSLKLFADSSGAASTGPSAGIARAG